MRTANYVMVVKKRVYILLVEIQFLGDETSGKLSSRKSPLVRRPCKKKLIGNNMEISTREHLISVLHLGDGVRVGC